MSKTNECIECLAPAAETLTTTTGDGLCSVCAAEYYVACGDCKAFTPRDESKEADGVAYCLACFERLFNRGATSDVNEADVDALVAEYIRLDDEAKKIGGRLDQIKELLKQAAASRERIAGAVTLGAGETAIKCSYSISYKTDSERVDALESVLGPERFATLFERKVTVSPVKATLERLLSDTSDEDAETRHAVRTLVDVVETPRLTVQRARPKKSRPNGEGT